MAPVAILPVASITGGRSNMCSLGAVSNPPSARCPSSLSPELMSMSEFDLPCPSSNNTRGNTRPSPVFPFVETLGARGTPFWRWRSMFGGTCPSIILFGTRRGLSCSRLSLLVIFISLLASPPPVDVLIHPNVATSRAPLFPCCTCSPVIPESHRVRFNGRGGTCQVCPSVFCRFSGDPPAILLRRRSAGPPG